MSLIDNTLASQVPTFDPATPLAQAAKLQAADQEIKQAQYKQMQTEIGSEARGLQPFVNTPEFPAKWAETADRMLEKGLLTPQAHQQWRNTPSPLLLKQMIAQTEDPTLTFRKQEAQREQGNTDRSFGLQKVNADRTYGLAVRAADRADDETPDNFTANPDFGKVAGAPKYVPIGPADPNYLQSVATAKARAAASVPPEGYEENPAAKTDQSAPKFIPQSGGPNDPATVQTLAAAKAKIPRIVAPGEAIVDIGSGKETYRNAPAGGAGGLTPEALEIRARQWNKGDYEGATKNVGRGAQGSATLEAISNKAAELLTNSGMTPEDAAAHVSGNMQKFKASGIGQNAEARTSATREANLNLILKATDAAIPAALEQSEKVARTGWVPLNQVIQKGEVIASDPELRKFGMANLQLAEHWARAMNPTGVMRESDRDKALSFLSTADSKDTYKQVVMQLKTQITRERDAIRGTSAKTPVSIGGYTIREN